MFTRQGVRQRAFKQLGGDVRERRQSAVAARRQSGRAIALRKRRTHGDAYDVPGDTTAALHAAVAMLFDASPDRQAEGARTARRVLSVADPPIDAALAIPQLVVRLVYLLATHLAADAAWALCNLVSGQNEAQTQHVVRAGAIPALARAAREHPDWQARHQALWALSNIAITSNTLRDAVVSSGADASARDMFARGESEEVVSTAAWALGNFALSRAANVARACIGALGAMMCVSQSGAVVGECVAALRGATSEPANAEFVCNTPNVLARAVQLASRTEPDAITEDTIGMLANTAFAGSAAARCVFAAGALSPLVPALLSPRAAIASAAARAMANLATALPFYSHTVVGPRFITNVVHLLRTSADTDVVRECVWLVLVVCSKATAALVGEFVTGGIVPPLCGILRSAGDTLVLCKAIETMLAIMRCLASSRGEFVAHDARGALERCRQLPDAQVARSAADAIAACFGE